MEWAEFTRKEQSREKWLCLRPFPAWLPLGFLSDIFFFFLIESYAVVSRGEGWGMLAHDWVFRACKDTKSVVRSTF